MSKHQPRIDLFVYGTLREPLVQRHVFKRVFSDMQRDALIGWRRAEVYIPGEGKFPAIVRGTNGSDSVKGLILHGLTISELWRLAHYETDAYVLREVALVSGHRALVCAWSGKYRLVEGSSAAGRRRSDAAPAQSSAALPAPSKTSVSAIR